MLSNYETWCFLFVGAYMITKGPWSPWAGYVCGAFIMVLSIVKLVG
jgi:hypothetical protein